MGLSARQFPSQCTCVLTANMKDGTVNSFLAEPTQSLGTVMFAAGNGWSVVYPTG